jgi:hypothetical protein
MSDSWTSISSKRCPCCGRLMMPLQSKCTLCELCKESNDAWEASLTCPRTLAKTLRSVTPEQVEAEHAVVKEKKPYVEQDRTVKPFRPKYEPF